MLSIELAEAAGAHGLTSLPGSSPDVGVIGYTLGGGLSWLGRQYGFACNNVTGIDVVTAACEQRSVTAVDDPDLFWALRGGGGGYAIVTALHLALLPIAEVYGGILIFPAELGAGAFRAYRDWAATAPEEITTVVRLLRPPPIPDVPEPLRGKALITIDGAFTGGNEAGEELIAPLRAIGEPIIDSFGPMPAAGLGRIHMDPEQPVPGLTTHAPIAELTDEAIEAFVANGPGPETGSTLLLAELRQLGGALARRSEGGGALDRLDFPFVMSAVGALMAPDAAETVPRDLKRLDEAMAPVPRRRRLLQLRRLILRRRRDPPRRHLRPPRRGQAPLRPRRPHRRQPRRRARRGGVAPESPKSGGVGGADRRQPLVGLVVLADQLAPISSCGLDVLGSREGNRLDIAPSL